METGDWEITMETWSLPAKPGELTGMPEGILEDILTNFRWIVPDPIAFLRMT